MILDKELLFSDEQVVSATADSTNVVDLGEGTGRSMNPRLRVFAQVTDAPTGLTSLKAELKGSADGTTYVTVADSGAVALASLVKGAQMFKDIPYLVDANYRFYKIAYTVAGTATKGATVTAGLIADGIPVTELTH